MKLGSNKRLTSAKGRQCALLGLKMDPHGQLKGRESGEIMLNQNDRITYSISWWIMGK